MCHVGDVHAHLPVAVAEATDGQGVVKVLGVDGESGDVAEILALGHFLLCDPFLNLLGRFLHILGIFVRQAEFSQDGVHLGVVLPFDSEDVYYFAARVHLVVAPLHDAGHGLVAVLATLEASARQHDVGGQELGIRHKGGIVLLYLKRADKLLVLGLDYLYDLSLRLLALAGGADHHAHLVAVQGVHRVALGHEYLLVVHHHGVLAVAAAHEVTDVFGAAVGLGLVFAQLHLHDVVGGCKLVEHVDHIHPVRGMRGPDAERYLFIIKALLIVLLQKTDYQRRQVTLADACRTLIFLCRLGLHNLYFLPFRNDFFSYFEPPLPFS